MATMSTNLPFNDDLDALFGSAPTTPRVLPIAYAHIRETVPEFVESCPKCRGTGRFISYAGRDCGPCFACKGAGKREFKTSPQQREKARTSAADRKARDAQANIDAFKATQPAAWAWIEAKRATFNFAADVAEKIARWGDLHPNTLTAVLRCVARDEERDAARAAEKAAREAANPSLDIDASKIAEAFGRAREAGLTQIGLYFNELCFRPARKDPVNLIYVTAGKGFNATYYGKITGGKFIPARDCPADVKARIVIVAADPMAAAQAYGYETGTCCVCGRDLTNKESVETGIGPVCAGRMGWTPGGLVRKAADGDF